MTIECPSCAVEIDSTSEECPICGYEFPQKKKSYRWVALLMLLLFAWPLIRLIMRFLHL